jgi:hypothetical protein
MHLSVVRLSDFAFNFIFELIHIFRGDEIIALKMGGKGGSLVPPVEALQAVITIQGTQYRWIKLWFINKLYIQLSIRGLI